jgi:hypothetical protein
MQKSVRMSSAVLERRLTKDNWTLSGCGHSPAKLSASSEIDDYILTKGKRGARQRVQDDGTHER